MSAARWIAIGIAALAAACGEHGKSPADADIVMPLPDAPACIAGPNGPAKLHVKTTSGPIRGVQAGETFAYYGVPYAGGAGGENRFQVPQLAACSQVELDTSVRGPMCSQLDDHGVVLGREDSCLQLNIWAPSAAGPLRPVMVWLHGGANARGDASDPLYDGQHLAETGNVIVVNVNYRLAQLGFLDSDTLFNAGQGSGNFGVTDQLEALAWINRNIAAFGGNPGNVTIFGSEAGGTDACAIIGSSVASGLFERAILQSGQCRGLLDRSQSVPLGDNFIAAIGCQMGDIGCLRARTATEVQSTLPPDRSLLPAPNAPRYGPVVGSGLQFSQPFDEIFNGTASRVALLVGADADETALAAPAIATAADYQTLLTARFGANGTAIAAHYPAAAFPTPRDAFVRATTDGLWWCPTRDLMHAAAPFGVSLYRYLWSHVPTGLPGAVDGAEVAYVFGNFSAWTVNGAPYQPTAADLALADAIQQDWIGFATSAAPAGLPAWPLWTTSIDSVRVYGDTVSVATGPRGADCDFWQTLPAQ